MRIQNRARTSDLTDTVRSVIVPDPSTHDRLHRLPDRVVLVVVLLLLLSLLMLMVVLLKHDPANFGLCGRVVLCDGLQKYSEGTAPSSDLRHHHHPHH
jgi:hypothetical protein